MEAGILKTISTFVLIATLSTPAAASVQIVERDGRFELQAPNETPRAVINALAQRFRFEVVFPDQTWGGTRGDFERLGTLDVLLKYVLDGTNYVAKYWSPDAGVQPTVTRVEIIGTRSGSSQIESAPADNDGVAQIEMEPAYDGVDATEDQSAPPQSESAKPAGVARATVASSTRESVPPKTVVSTSGHPQSISEMLATRANVQPASAQPTTGAATISSDQQAQLREMTQRAHAGVTDLANALRRADAATQQSAAEQK